MAGVNGRNLSGECYGKSVPSGPMGRLAEWPAGRGYFQRFAACHACRRWRFLTLFLTFARASIAGGLALLLILLRRETRPTRRQAASLAIVCAGVVVGFPLLTALALQHVTSAHSMVFIGLLPLATALFGVLRGGERPARPSGFSRYWAACWRRVLPSPGMCGSHYRATC